MENHMPELTVREMNRDIVKPATMPVPYGDPATLMAVISRAAADPNTDVTKLERLMAMYERITAQSAKAAYAAALATMQGELPIVDEKGLHEGTKKTYAKWDDIIEAIRPILSAHGFSYQCDIKQADGKITVTGILSHAAGFSKETSVVLPADKTGQKNDVQAIGSSFSYGMRYAAKALLAIGSRKSDDDDGVAAGNGEVSTVISAEQLKDLRALIEAKNAPIERLCKHFIISALPELPSDRFAEAKGLLTQMKRVGS